MELKMKRKTPGRYYYANKIEVEEMGRICNTTIQNISREI
jgi:hypothetical protein